MPYRVRSTDVWFNMPGVVAAYQSIAAPDSFAARQNVAHNGARVGISTATPGVTPMWIAAAGWFFDGATQYLKSGVVPTPGWSMMVQFSGGSSDGSYKCIAGQYNSGTTRLSLHNRHTGVGGAMVGNGNYTTVPYMTKGNLATSGQGAYVNGIFANNIGAWSGTTTRDVYLGCENASGVTDEFFSGFIRTFLIASRILSPAEVWLAARQMAYSEQNPDWNAWSRRRRYYYVYAPPPVETGSALAAEAGTFGIRFAGSPQGAHSSPRRPHGPVGGHRGPLYD